MTKTPQGRGFGVKVPHAPAAPPSMDHSSGAGSRRRGHESVMMIVRAVAVWVVLIMVEILHGIARGIFLVPRVGDLMSRQIGVFTGSVLIFTIALLSVRWIRATRTTQLLFIGMIWLALTIAFEIVFGRLVLGYSWYRIFSDYNIIKGGLMPFGMVVLALSPVIAGKARGVA